MKKRDVELVLEKSLEFFRENLKEHVNLVDIHALAFQIWKEIEFETDWEENIVELILTKSQLISLEENGDTMIELKDGPYVYITFVDDSNLTSITESGKIYIWGEEAEEDN